MARKWLFGIWMTLALLLVLVGSTGTEMMAGKISVPVAQVINWLILSFALALSIIFVGRDTRRRDYSWPETIVWVIISTATFPIVFGLYFFLRGRISRKLETRIE